MTKQNIHVVQPGDTLERIAEKCYGDPRVSSLLAEVNGIKDFALLETGQKILIPEKLFGLSECLPSTDEGEDILQLRATWVMCPCFKIQEPWPPKENYPYDQQTFDMIARLKDIIIKAGELVDVPEVAIAGSIADEFNTMRGYKQKVDWIQDHIYVKLFSEDDFQVNARAGMQGFGKSHFMEKFMNVTMHDLGIGNIKLETAMSIYKRYPGEFANESWGYSELVDYLNSDVGTVHLAALVIKDGLALLWDNIFDYPSCRREAVLVTYYKQGPKYHEKWLNRKVADPSAHINSGEGCRVCLQRERILQALGLSQAGSAGSKAIP